MMITMTSFVCCNCYKTFDKCKSFSNHMHKWDNEGGVAGDDCDVADAVVNDVLDYTMHQKNGENFFNYHQMINSLSTKIYWKQ